MGKTYLCNKMLGKGGRGAWSREEGMAELRQGFGLEVVHLCFLVTLMAEGHGWWACILLVGSMGLHIPKVLREAGAGTWWD